MHFFGFTLMDDMSDSFHAFRLSGAVRKKLKNKSLVRAELEQGKSGLEILELPEETMEKLSQASYLLFEQKRAAEASCAFLFLASICSNEGKYWLGLGMSLQFSHEYEAAIDAYEMAALCDIQNPVPYFYLAKCLFAIHDRDGALQALDLAIETAGDEHIFAEIKKQSELARQLLLEER